MSCRVPFPRAPGSNFLLKSPLFPSISALGRLLGHSLRWLGLTTTAGTKGRGPGAAK